MRVSKHGRRRHACVELRKIDAPCGNLARLSSLRIYVRHFGVRTDQTNERAMTMRFKPVLPQASAIALYRSGGRQ